VGHAELGWPTGQRGRGAGNAEQRAFGSGLVREGRGRVCLVGPGYQRPNKERGRGVSGACGSSWAGRRVRLGQRGPSVAERVREVWAVRGVSGAEAGCAARGVWATHGRERSWAWLVVGFGPGFKLGWGVFYFPSLF